MFKLLSILAAVTAIGVGVAVYFLQKPSKLPDLDLQKWWGLDPKREEDPSIRRFQIDFNDTMIQDLKQRLRNKRPLTKPLQGIQSQYGMNTDYLEKIIKYWIEKYDFKKRADLMNQFPHFKTRIQGLDIHFLRVRPQVKAGIKVLPLLMLHGWPSSSKEYHKVIPMFTAPRNGYDFVFEVVAADLPGFGFSEGTNKPGLSPVQIGIIIRNLMRRLGFEHYYIQAGDWGSQCATHMATMFPDEVLGFHTNMPISSRPISTVKLILGSLFPSLIDPKHWHRLYPLTNFLTYILRESGYFHIQATKPDTIGVALTDSPAGLAAYTMEKIGIVSNRDQTDTPHGGIENLELDDVLDTVTIIWANNCIVTSMRIYAEGSPATAEVNILHNIPSPVPTAAINFKYEVIYQPDWLLRDKFPNLVRTTTLEFGGHFAALQTPKELADDVFDAVVDFSKFHRESGDQKKLYRLRKMLV